MNSIDVIIPVYNDEQCILDSISSALNLVDVIVNLIVVNDGSTDNTEKVLKDSKYWGRFEYIKKTNGGVASARNTGLMKLNSEYCCFLDSDDYLEPFYAKLLIQFMESNKLLIAYSDYIFVTEKDISKELKLKKKKAPNKISMKELLNQNIFMTPTVLFSTSLIGSKLFFENLKYYEDWVFWLGLIDSAYYAVYYDKCLVRIRTRKNGLTLNKEIHAANYLLAIKEVEKRYKIKYKKYIRNAYIFYANGLRGSGKMLLSLEYWLKSFPTKNFFLFSFPYFLKFVLKCFNLDQIAKKVINNKKDRNSV